MYFDDCKNPKELGRLIKEILDYCFKDNTLPSELSERLFPPSEQGYNNSLEMYLMTLHNKARHKAREFREQNPNLPPLPKEQDIGFKGLGLIQEWCIEAEKPAETGQKTERSMFMVTVRSSKENWEAIKSEYGISKRDFGKKINFVSDPFKRGIIFRDIEHAFVLASKGFSKPALILAGGVIEELLRLYLEHKNIKPKGNRFVNYIEACENNRLLKCGVSRLTDSIRDFRNLVHLYNEKTKRHTISKATAKGAVSSIFTIANDFQ